MIKRIVLSILIVVIIFCLCACEGRKETKKSIKFANSYTESAFLIAMDEEGIPISKDNYNNIFYNVEYDDEVQSLLKEITDKYLSSFRFDKGVMQDKFEYELKIKNITYEKEMLKNNEVIYFLARKDKDLAESIFANVVQNSQQ